MKKKLSLLILVVVIITLFLPSTALAANELSVSNKITMPGSDDHSGFGYKTALYENTLAVLSVYYKLFDIENSKLFLYIYDLSQSDPQSPIVTIDLSEMVPYLSAGYDLAVSDDYLLVGIPQYEDGTESACGAVLIYNLNDSNIEETKILLTEPTPDYSHYFGTSVAIYGDNIVVGGKAFTSEPAYIFSLSSFTLDSITSSAISVTSDNDRHFGEAVGIYQNNVVVCTSYDTDTDTGTAYLYDLNASDVDGSKTKIRTSPVKQHEKFGIAAAISDDWVAISSLNNSAVGNDSGKVYLFDLNADIISQTQQIIVSSDARAGDNFGSNLSISGDLLLVTASKSGSGAVYIYDLSASDISSSEIKVVPAAEDNNSSFGNAADIYGKQIIIGDRNYSDSTIGYHNGAVYYTSLSTISLEKDGGTGGDNYILAVTGNAMPFATAPTRTGYTFGGYYTERNGSGTKYYNADMSSAKNWDINGDITLYANWIANQYTVTFDKQYGSGGDDDTLATFDSEMPSLSPPSKVAFSFAGYFSEPYGKGAKYYNDDMSSAHVWNIDSATTLYAYWDSNPSATYTVSFDSQGGSAVSSQDIAYGGYATKPNPPTKGSFFFDGWYTTSTAADGTQWNFESCPITHATRLYAKWIASYSDSVTDIEFDNAYKAIKVGNSSNVATICPYSIYSASALDKTVSWTSSNPTVATISGTTLTAHAEGKTIITIESNDHTNGTIKSSMVVEVLSATTSGSSHTGKSIAGQIVAADGSVISNCCVTTYSDPLYTLTNSSGEFVIENVPYTHHTLIVSNSSGNEIGRFNLNFNSSSNNNINIDNSTNTANISFSPNTSNVNFTFQVNNLSNDIDIISSGVLTQVVANPETGTDIQNISYVWSFILISALFIFYQYKKHINHSALKQKGVFRFE